MDPVSQPKKLYRSRSDRLIAGVCGGLGNYFHIDPTWVRLLFIVLLLAFGSTFFVYILMWIIVPEEPLLPEKIEQPPSQSDLK